MNTRLDVWGLLRLVRTSFFIALLGSWAAVTVPAADSKPPLKTADDLDQFSSDYYRNPRPDLIDDAIKAFAASGFAADEAAHAPFVAFFAEIFVANPDEVPNWRKLISRQKEPTRSVLMQAVELSQSGGALSLEGHAAALNDIYWGAFFASGNPAFVLRLVDELKFLDEREDGNLFWAGGTAKWSLASNAIAHPLVRSTLEEARVQVDLRTRESVDDLLTKDPSIILEELRAIYDEQNGAGGWR